VLSYTQRLPNTLGRTQYRFPAGHNLVGVRDWSLHVRVKDGARLDWSTDSHPRVKARGDGGDLILEDEARDVAINRDVVLNFDERNRSDDAEPAHWSQFEQDGGRYLMVRFRPKLTASRQGAGQSRPQRNWVVLFESSGDRDPLLARAQIDIIRNLLDHAEGD